MKFLANHTSRFIALLLLITFTFVSCYNPLDKITKERFRVTIQRHLIAGYDGDGKVAFGFCFANNADVFINEDIQPVEHKFFDEQPSVHRDAVVIRF
jgi:hypothetical protein